MTREIKKGDRVRHKVGKFEGMVKAIKSKSKLIIKIMDIQDNRTYFKDMDLTLPFDVVTRVNQDEYEVVEPPMGTRGVWVFWDRKLNIMKVFGSVTVMHQSQEIIENGKKLNLRTFRTRLIHSNEYRNSRYIIQLCPLHRSPNKHTSPPIN